MGILTAQKVASYYDRFKGIDVTFTKDMLQVTGLLTEQVHLKCGSDFWPCVLYATSFQGAKIIVNIRSGLIEKLQQANNVVNLRLCFKNAEANPVTFFVAGHVVGSIPYKSSSEVYLLTIQYPQRPPDDLIEIVGRVLDANVNSSKRKDERIILTVETQRRLKLLTKETAAFIQAVPRRCLLRELSFSNAKLIMMGVAKFLVDKETALRVDFDDPRESFLVRGKFIRSEDVEGKKEMIALAMEFDLALVPTGYKIRINEYLSTTWADSRTASSGETNGNAAHAEKHSQDSAQPADEGTAAGAGAEAVDEAAADAAAGAGAEEPGQDSAQPAAGAAGK